jgi:hypothetical protein
MSHLAGHRAARRLPWLGALLIAFVAPAAATPLLAQGDVTCIPVAERAGREFGCLK